MFWPPKQWSSLLLDYPLMHLHPGEELIDCLAAWCTLLSRLLFHHLLLELLHGKQKDSECLNIKHLHIWWLLGEQYVCRQQWHKPDQHRKKKPLIVIFDWKTDQWSFGTRMNDIMTKSWILLQSYSLVSLSSTWSTTLNCNCSVTWWLRPWPLSVS